MANSGQNYRNHARFFPLFHFFVVPVLVLNVLNGIRHVWMSPNRSTAFGLLVAIALVMAALASRLMALKVQDRVIRLELQGRMRGVLPADLQTRMHQLTPAQMVALRFASDRELADLVRDVLDGKLANQKAIKGRIEDWQGDYLRA